MKYGTSEHMMLRIIVRAFPGITVAQTAKLLRMTGDVVLMFAAVAIAAQEVARLSQKVKL